KFPDFAQDYTRIKEARARLAEPTTAERYVTQPVGSFVRGAADTFASIPESLGQAQYQIGAGLESLGVPSPVARAVTEGAPGLFRKPFTERTAQDTLGGEIAGVARSGFDKIAPASTPGLEESVLSTKLPGALGSGAAF